MTALPDQFDLCVRKARETSDPERGLDYCLGALFALPVWHFPSAGAITSPSPTLVEWQDQGYFLVFSSAARLADTFGAERPNFSVPTAEATPFLLEYAAGGAAGILVNPGDYAFAVTMEGLKDFHAAWQARGSEARGFWIPNMTSEEDDFWQELGIE